MRLPSIVALLASVAALAPGVAAQSHAPAPSTHSPTSRDDDRRLLTNDDGRRVYYRNCAEARAASGNRDQLHL